jgi:hypothetical protein
VNDLYHGNFPGYRACNTGYHDFNHASACMVLPLMAAYFPKVISLRD